MWAMMSPEQHYDNEEIGGGGASRHVYVHHVNEENHINPMMGYPRLPQPQLPPQLPPQPMFIPMPYPQTMPMQMPMFMGGGGGYGYPQFPQQPIVIISGSGDEEKAKDGGEKGGGGETKSPPPPPPPPEPKRPPFHPACLVSIIFFVIGSILGFICVAKIYDVFESSLSYDENQEQDENKDVDEHILDYLVVHRTVALGMGAVSILMFCIAFMLAFYAGMRYRLSGGGSSSKKKNCCLTGLLISAWILFCLTFINGLIILVLAFDEGARIYPEVALCAVLGNMAAWICMFSYCLLARIL
jgi:hypothetical protein